ncbi:MAG: ATP-binding cassette domain-containing protein [Gammaproteobacteria bacterium]|nr:ATP-binding cassette domain-containing protein [Gammaproteobacteria bacterium]
MATPLPIRANAVVPRDEVRGEKLPAFSIELNTSGTTCLLGSDHATLTAYLRTMAGIDAICGGELLLFGESLQRIGQLQWQQLRRQLGYVAHNAPLLSVLNGMENLVLPALYHKTMNRRDAEEAARQLLAALHCQADLNVLPAYLTPLERTQLAIARAAILDPAVLFLDEPYHELDVHEHADLNDFLRLWTQEHALVISTANLRFARQQADRIIFAGAQKILYFDSWEAFVRSGDSAVTDHLQRYRDTYHL